MLMPTTDGTFMAGPFDVLCILHRSDLGRFHVCFMEEQAFPGPYQDRLEGATVIRLRSRMHHTEGAPTLEGALVHLAEMRKKINVLPTNIWLLPREWDGSEGFMWICDNWLKDPVKAYNDLEAALRDPTKLMMELKAALHG